VRSACCDVERALRLPERSRRLRALKYLAGGGQGRTKRKFPRSARLPLQSPTPPSVSHGETTRESLVFHSPARIQLSVRPWRIREPVSRPQRREFGLSIPDLHRLRCIRQPEWKPIANAGSVAERRVVSVDSTSVPLPRALSSDPYRGWEVSALDRSIAQIFHVVLLCPI
jgi:hypothetical protein